MVPNSEFFKTVQDIADKDAESNIVVHDKLTRRTFVGPADDILNYCLGLNEVLQGCCEFSFGDYM